MSVAAGQLKSIIERIETLEVEKGVIAAGLKEVYAEAKSNGFDTKVLREIIKLRRMEAAEREELESLIGVYMAALGMTKEDGNG